MHTSNPKQDLTVVIDAAELEAAWKDEKVQQVLAAAKAAHKRSTRI